MFGVPDSHCYGDNLILVHKTRWVDRLINEAAVPGDFDHHPDLDHDDLRALLRVGEAPNDGDDGWILLAVDRYGRRRGATVCPLAHPVVATAAEEDEDLCFAEALRYVAQSNLVNAWKEAFNTWKAPHQLGGGEGEGNHLSSFGLDHDVVLLEVLSRLYSGCPVIPASADVAVPMARQTVVRVGGEVAHHRAKALAVIVEADHVNVLRPFLKYSVHHALTFSPAFFGDAAAHRQLFVLYQILRAMNDVHNLGLAVGDVSLRDVALTAENLVLLKPDVEANLVKVEADPTVGTAAATSELVDPTRHLSDESAVLLKSLRSVLKEGTEVMTTNFLGTILKLWMHGRMSNFDYILFLNYLSGRTYSNPNFYPVMPWVRDFSGRLGGWRDLSKSKFRLNKGDTQLDLTYDPNDRHHPVPPHHVTDVLSEITYYVYKARRTSKSVLCKHVRQRWVPAEYPSSMRRLQAWTPDECIPDFYADPDIFRSVHEDLPDLEVPAWCRDPEEFVEWHRAALDSAQVSDKLHQWVDLTFGYKLSGGSAVRAKNVCLHLVDNHGDLRSNGVVQLFNHPHPQKKRANPFWDKVAPRLDSFLNRGTADDDPDSTSEDPGWVESSPIALPRDYEPFLKMQELEGVNAFLAKSGATAAVPTVPHPTTETQVETLAEEMSQRQTVRDMQVLGCLVVELFLPKKFLTLGRHAALSTRLKSCRAVALENESHLLPSSVRHAVLQLLDSTEGYPTVGEVGGLPPPSAFQLLLPQVSSFAFPKQFPVLAAILREVEDLDAASQAGDDVEVEQKVGEFKVKLVASRLSSMSGELSVEDVHLLLPLIKKLLTDSSTSILAAWYLLDPVAKVLGRRVSTEELLVPMLSIYEAATPTSTKHLKLYHRTFLQFLLVRFGTQSFLRYFSTFLIEAVGGYRDYHQDNHHPDSSGGRREGLERGWVVASSASDNNLNSLSRSQSRLSSSAADPASEEDNYSKSVEEMDKDNYSKSVEETFAEGEVFSFDSLSLNEDSVETASAATKDLKGVIYIPPASTYEYVDEEGEEDMQEEGDYQKQRGPGGNISQAAGESVLWLAHRVGPVLTAKHVTRNLLRMLNLCYLEPDSAVASPDKFPDQRIRVGPKKLHGDNLAQNVLECLGEIACLYGDHVILLQYLPYAWDILSTCKKKLTPNLEAGVLGVLALVHHIVPYLSDSLLMKELPDNILANVLFPTLQVMSSRSACFQGGWRLRQALAYKFLDVLYLVGLRIGEEMSRSHLTPLCAAFFSSLDKVYDREGRTLDIAGESEDSKVVSAELARVFSPEVTYAAYVAFYNLMGRAHLDESIINLDVVKTLCLLQQERVGESQLPRPATFSCLLRGYHGSSSSPLSSSGNKVDVVVGSSTATGNSLLVPSSSSYQSHRRGGNDDLHSLISKEIGSSSSRHLKGNWLAYWEHEIGRSDKDNRFNLKQIKLQGFCGHGGGVKTLHTLDNENSFMSGSRDRTVKVWSLRSQGDGNANVGCQWTYTLHRKSVFAVVFVESLRLAASCDSTVHVWDPFVGAGVHQVDPQRLGGGLVHVLTPLAAPSPVLVAVTGDSVLHLVDCRAGSSSADLKVSVGSTGLVKALSASSDGNTVIVGHSSGYISLMDLRTGKLRNAWKGHEGEVLNLTPLEPNEFLSTSLDQTVTIWLAAEGRLKCHLSGAQEPVHCVSYVGESGDVVVGTTANRVGVRHGTTEEAAHHFSKLRPDVIKGNLTAMRVLPMNGQLLVGQDNGSITLMC